MKVRKAVIPAAGLGTRFLPATKAQPKEMLPLVDKPAIQYVVEQAVEAGLRDILIITGRGKRTLEDHFDRSFELEYRLEQSGKIDDLKVVRDISDMASVHYIRQKEPLGLGAAVAMAEPHVGGEPFAVLLGDDIITTGNLLADMIGVYDRYGRSVIAGMEVPRSDIHLYGAISPEFVEDNLARVISIVEKPPTEEAPSNLAAIGGYPIINVPLGDLFGLPMGISFFGTAFSEPTLIKLASGFEAATHARILPTFVESVTTTNTAGTTLTRSKKMTLTPSKKDNPLLRPHHM